MWQKQWEAFGDFHCLIPDLPDHGKSVNEGKIDILDSTERIAGLIRDHANGGRAHVVGHSLGGKIIVQLLATCPALIDHAVVASALFRPIPMMNMIMNMPMYKLTVSMLKNKWVLENQVKQFNFPNDFYRNSFIREVSGETAEVLDRIYTQLNKHLILPAGLEKAQVHTLVLAGEKEPSAMKLSAGDIVKVLPNAKAYLVKGALHNFPWVQYEAFNDVIRQWINDKVVDNETIMHM